MTLEHTTEGSALECVKQRMRTATQLRPGLDCIAIANLLDLEDGADALPLDVILNQIREATPGSAAIDATAEQILKTSDPLSTLDKLLSLGALTGACLEVAAVVLKRVDLAHPLLATTDLRQAKTMPAFDLRVRDATLDMQFWTTKAVIEAGGAVVLLDLGQPTQTWIVCSIESIVEASHLLRLRPLIRRFIDHSDAAKTVRYLSDPGEIMSVLRAPRPNLNPSFITVSNTILDPAIALALSDQADVLAARLMDRAL
jgi:hypothetical protein